MCVHLCGSEVTLPANQPSAEATADANYGGYRAGKLCGSEEKRGQQSESSGDGTFVGGLILHFSSPAQRSSESAEADCGDSFVAARVMRNGEGGRLISRQLFPPPLLW